jgi:hypothetical protein
MEWILGAAAIVAAFAILGGVAKGAFILCKVALAIVLLPFHLIGALLAVAGTAIVLPVLVLAAVAVVLGLVTSLVLLPLAPIALLVAGIVAVVRLTRPRHA